MRPYRIEAYRGLSSDGNGKAWKTPMEGLNCRCDGGKGRQGGNEPVCTRCATASAARVAPTKISANSRHLGLIVTRRRRVGRVDGLISLGHHVFLPQSSTLCRVNFARDDRRTVLLRRLSDRNASPVVCRTASVIVTLPEPPSNRRHRGLSPPPDYIVGPPPGDVRPLGLEIIWTAIASNMIEQRVTCSKSDSIWFKKETQ